MGMNHALNAAALICTAVVLTGCWTAPVANVQPKGEPRLIQRGIVIDSVKHDATVQAIDPEHGTLVLLFPGSDGSTLAPGAGVVDFSKLRAGDKVRAKVTQTFSVYVLKDGKLPGPDGKPELIASSARVLTIEPSYRLLTLQYPGGDVESFKVGLEARLHEMEAGDDVGIETTALTALRINKH